MHTTRAALTALIVLALAPLAPAEDPPRAKPRAKAPKIDLAALLEMHNKARAEENLAPLKRNDKLDAAARVHAKDMADHDKMTHEGSDGSDAAQRVKRQDYRFQEVGENVAEGQKTSEEVMRAWMKSPHHRENILRPAFTEIGLACSTNEEGVPFWCVDFGKPWPKIEPEAGATSMLSALNAARAGADKPPLKVDDTLQQAAQTHADAMAEAGKFLRKDPDGQAPTERAQKAGYTARAIAQSDASGQGEPAKAVKSWTDSGDSRKVVLGDYRDVGIGVATDKDGVPYWCVIFGTPRAR